jgi:hypothetical protein
MKSGKLTAKKVFFWRDHVRQTDFPQKLPSAVFRPHTKELFFLTKLKLFRQLINNNDLISP